MSTTAAPTTTVNPDTLNQQFNTDLNNLNAAQQTTTNAAAQLKAASAALGSETGYQQYMGALQLVYGMMNYVGDVLGVNSDKSLVANDLQADNTGIQSLNEQMMQAGGSIWQAQQQVNSDQAYITQLNNDPNATTAQKNDAQMQLSSDQVALLNAQASGQATLNSLAPTMISMLQTYQSNLTAAEPFLPPSVFSELQTNLGNMVNTLSNGATTDPFNVGPYSSGNGSMNLQQSICYMYQTYLSTTPPSSQETTLLNAINGSASVLSSVNKQQMIVEQNLASRFTQMIALISKINGNINSMNSLSVNNQTKGG